jgi:hypothetical protein
LSIQARKILSVLAGPLAGLLKGRLGGPGRTCVACARLTGRVYHRVGDKRGRNLCFSCVADEHVRLVWGGEAPR